MLSFDIANEYFLMAIATLGAIIIQEIPEATAVMVFYSIGEYLQSRAVNKSRNSIGELLDISADTFEDENGNPFYRVRLRTYETELKRKNEVLPIIPGMIASVDILTGKKTVMQYLLKPFVKTLDNAMNER